MKFRISTILWFFALLASAMATFGAWPGSLGAPFVLVVWLTKFNKMPTPLDNLIVIIAVFWALWVLLVPVVYTPRSPARRNICLNNLRNLEMALHFYEDVNGEFPTAVELGPHAKPWHSWRTRILPSLEHKRLHELYDYGQPWKAPANEAVTSRKIEYFQCPSDPRISYSAPTTNYFAVRGPNTMWPDGRGRKLDEVTDAHKQTILLIEAAGRGVNWAEPRDFTFDEAVEFLSTRSPNGAVHRVSRIRPGFFYKPYYESSRGINVVMVGGHVRTLRIPIPRDLAAALLTVNGGEPVALLEFERLTAAQIDYARIYSLVVFILLSLAPGVKVMRQRGGIWGEDASVARESNQEENTV